MRRNPTNIWPSTIEALHTDSGPSQEASTTTQQTVACAKCPPGTLHAQIVFEQGTSLCMDHRTMYEKGTPQL